MTKTVLRIAVMLVLMAACKKKEDPEPAPAPAPDQVKPTLVLKGNASDTIALNSTYNDPGVTANDDVDGDLSASVTIVGSVDKDRTGGNYIYYNVKDKAGNSAQISRYVYVRNEAYRFAGNYSALSNCGGSFNGLNSTCSIDVSSSVNNKIVFSNQQFQSSGFGVAATVNGTLMTMYTQPVGSSLGSGTGTVSADGKSFTLVTSYNPPIQGSSGCVIVYTKQ